MSGRNQLLFPDFKEENTKDEPPVRLNIDLSITIKDTWTGERISQKISMNTDDPNAVMKHMVRALEHKKTEAIVGNFVEGREGFNVQMGSAILSEVKFQRVPDGAAE